MSVYIQDSRWSYLEMIQDRDELHSLVKEVKSAVAESHI